MEWLFGGWTAVLLAPSAGVLAIALVLLVQDTHWRADGMGRWEGVVQRLRQWLTPPTTVRRAPPDALYEYLAEERGAES